MDDTIIDNNQLSTRLLPVSDISIPQLIKKINTSDEKYYEVTLSIGHNGTVATVYNVGKTKESVSPSAKTIAVVGSMPLGETPSDTIIPNSTTKVNTSDENYLKAVKNSDMQTALPVADSDDIRFALPLDSKSEKGYNEIKLLTGDAKP